MSPERFGIVSRQTTRIGDKAFWFPAALVVTCLGKLVVLINYGSLALGDNIGFVESADYILANSDWLFHLDLQSSAFPPTLWRPIGYSLVIAASKLLVGENWPLAVTTLQTILSLASGLLLYRLARSLGLNALLSSIVFLLFQSSTPFSTDTLIMEDAITGTLGGIGFLVILMPVARGELPRVYHFLAAGVLTALCFTIRDVYHFVMPLVGFFAFIVLWVMKHRRSAVLAFCALVGPVMVMSWTLQAWNQHRVGAPVTTTLGQSGYLYGVLRAAQYDQDILAGDGIYIETIRQMNKGFDYRDTQSINQALFTNHGFNSVELLGKASDLFWSTLISHPWAYIQAGAQRLRLVQQATLFAGPLTRMDDLDWWAGGAVEEGFRVGWRKEAQKFRQTLNPADLTPVAALNLGLRAVNRLIAIILFVIFIVGAPWYWLRHRHQKTAWASIVGISWLVYGLWLSLYLPVSFEVRYLSPVIGPAILSMVMIVQALACRLGQRRQDH